MSEIIIGKEAVVQVVPLDGLQVHTCVMAGQGTVGECDGDKAHVSLWFCVSVSGLRVSWSSEQAQRAACPCGVGRCVCSAVCMLRHTGVICT